MIIWLVGLSGSGKTTIGQKLCSSLQKTHPNTVLVDGDIIRELFKHDRLANAHDVEGRRINAERIVDICRWLDQQGIHVVCAILCIFQDILEKNRGLFQNYFEVSITTPLEVVIERDIKNLYGPALKGEKTSVVGVDIPWDPPRSPDMEVANTGSPAEHAEIVATIVEQVGL